MIWVQAKINVALYSIFIFIPFIIPLAVETRNPRLWFENCKLCSLSFLFPVNKIECNLL